MKIERTLPPNYEEIVKTLNPTHNTCFTYGDTLYAPNLGQGEEIEPHLMVHEENHEKQQGEAPSEWWTKYLADPEFRLSQELEAYGAQYAFVKAQNLPERVTKNFLERIAGDLCSPLYGELLEQGEAESKIRNQAKGVVWYRGERGSRLHQVQGKTQRH